MTRQAMVAALVGNPNAGKSALFNALTGLRAHTANYPGTTVDHRVGRLTVGAAELELIDLPGLYDCQAHTEEEQVALDALRAQAERLRVLNADPAGLAVAEGAAHVATNETARMLEFFEGTLTFFNERLGVAGKGDRQDAARTIAGEAKKLKTTDLPKAQRMLDEALGQVEAIIANPSEAAASRPKLNEGCQAVQHFRVTSACAVSRDQAPRR